MKVPVKLVSFHPKLIPNLLLPAWQDEYQVDPFEEESIESDQEVLLSAKKQWKSERPSLWARVFFWIEDNSIITHFLLQIWGNLRYLGLGYLKLMANQQLFKKGTFSHLLVFFVGAGSGALHWPICSHSRKATGTKFFGHVFLGMQWYLMWI